MRLVWLLGAYSRNAHLKPQKIIGLETAEVAIEMVDEAVRILEEWPGEFHRFLDTLVQRRASSSSENKLGARFGSFYNALYKAFSGEEFDFLRAGFESYLRDNWQGQLAKRNRRLSPELRTEHEWVSIVEAAKTLGVRPPKVKVYLEQGLLKGRLHRTQGGRTMGVILIDSLTELLRRKQDCISLKDARQLLGVSRRKSYEFMAKGVLKPISGPTVDGQQVWGFRREDVMAIEPINDVSRYPVSYVRPHFADACQNDK